MSFAARPRPAKQFCNPPVCLPGDQNDVDNRKQANRRKEQERQEQENGNPACSQTIAVRI